MSNFPFREITLVIMQSVNLGRLSPEDKRLVYSYSRNSRQVMIIDIIDRDKIGLSKNRPEEEGVGIGFTKQWLPEGLHVEKDRKKGEKHGSKT